MLEGAGPTIARQKETIERLETERAGGMVVLRLDPRRIRPSSFANRHQKSLDAADPKFMALKSDIQRRGQLDPIRVRPITGDSGFDYEIVYGHRRHAVALALQTETETGFAILALLDAPTADAREHVLRMHSENFARSDLAPYEYGQMYTSWLAAKCFKNQEEIAAAVGLDQSMISTYVRIYRLPAPVLAAFGDPRRHFGSLGARSGRGVEGWRSKGRGGSARDCAASGPAGSASRNARARAGKPGATRGPRGDQDRDRQGPGQDALHHESER
jgi:ParB family chromosome partitioning protein